MALQIRIKRVFDCVVCLLSLIVVLPVLAICGVLIKLNLPGPVFFRQERVGLNRKSFRVIKPRTMVVNAEKIRARLYAVKDDPRYTKVGMFRRRFSLDELPQVFNVLAHHQRAISLYEKIGFQIEGRLRDDNFRNGQYRDALVMAILASEFLVGEHTSNG